MPTLGPDNRLMYFAHEVFDLVGRMKFGSDWSGKFTPILDAGAGLRLNLISQEAEMSHEEAHKKAFNDHVQTDDCLSYIEIIMASGWVVCWVQRSVMWSVYEPTHFQVNHDSEDGLDDSVGIKFFAHYIEKVMINGEGSDDRFLVEKISLDRVLKTVGSDVHEFIEADFKGAGGNTTTHKDKHIWKQILAEILYAAPKQKSKPDLVKRVIARLKELNLPTPSHGTMKNYIQFLSENNEI